jgi:hypothetical protein
MLFVVQIGDGRIEWHEMRRDINHGGEKQDDGEDA